MTHLGPLLHTLMIGLSADSWRLGVGCVLLKLLQEEAVEDIHPVLYLLWPLHLDVPVHAPALT